MKKETIKYIIQLIVAVLTAIGSTLSVTTAASGAPAEGVALRRRGVARQRWGPPSSIQRGPLLRGGGVRGGSGTNTVTTYKTNMSNIVFLYHP